MESTARSAAFCQLLYDTSVIFCDWVSVPFCSCPIIPLARDSRHVTSNCDLYHYYEYSPKALSIQGIEKSYIIRAPACGQNYYPRGVSPIQRPPSKMLFSQDKTTHAFQFYRSCNVFSHIESTDHALLIRS